MVEIEHRDGTREFMSIENYRNRVYRRDPMLLMVRVRVPFKEWNPK